MQKPDRKRADFYAARYLGVCKSAECEEGPFQDFVALRQLEPKAFVSGDWDPGFLDWFEKSVRARWGVPAERIRQKKRSFEIVQAAFENRYFATIVAYPELELWHVLKDGVVSEPLVMAMASFRDRPALYFGKIVKGVSVHSGPVYLDTKKRSLHHVWKPEFFDLDGDGKPELWVRFNIAWGNGFVQVLEVYRILDDKIVILKRFEGLPDGYARRLPDGRVETASAVRPEHKNYQVVTWTYKDKEFKKSGTKIAPFLPRTRDWAEVFTAP